MTNNRKKGSQKLRPGKIHVIGDGLTEFYYFKHLKELHEFDYLQYRSRSRNSSISEMEKTLKDLLDYDLFVICVFDLDVTEREAAENLVLTRVIENYQGNEKVFLCGTFPSIEYWFLLHYENIDRHLSSKEALSKLKRHLPAYKKETRFLSNKSWVQNLDCHLDDALTNARNFNKSRQCECLNDSSPRNRSCTDIYKAFDFFKERSQNQSPNLPKVAEST